MRQARRVTGVVVVLALLGGCTDQRRAAGQRLARGIDEARRLHLSVSSLLSDPQYVVEPRTGRLVPIKEWLEPASAPAPKPDAPNALDRLARARSILENGLRDNPQAPTGVVADANALLGEVLQSQGAYHLAAAEDFRSRAELGRRTGESLIGLVHTSDGLAKFYGQLGSLSAAEVRKLRDAADAEVKALDEKINTAKGEIARLQGEIDKVAEDCKRRRAEAARLRDQSEVATGPKSLDLLTQATRQFIEINRDESSIATNKQQIEFVKTDLLLLEKQRESEAVKQKALEEHLKGAGERGGQAAKDAKQADAESRGYLKGAVDAAADVVKHYRDVAEQEQKALAALQEAVRRFNAAQDGVRREWNAARAAAGVSPQPDEILQALADDQHLALVATRKASAEMAIGDLCRGQLQASRIDDAFAARLAEAAKALGEGAPPVTKELTGYVTDPTKTRELAQTRYAAAAQAMEEVVRAYHKGPVGKNILWMPQGQLAEAYFKQYRLSEDAATPDSGLLDKAEKVLGEALAEKADSPYLAGLVELEKIIKSARTPVQPEP